MKLTCNVPICLFGKCPTIKLVMVLRLTVVLFALAIKILALNSNPTLYKNIQIEKRPWLERTLNVSYDIVVFKHAEHPCDVCPRLPFSFVGANGADVPTDLKFMAGKMLMVVFHRHLHLP